MKTLTLSVHDIVDTLLRSGDIDNRAYNQETMEEGTLLHKIYQSKQGPSYLSEYFLSCEIVRGDFTLKISGRADGIIVQNGRIIIDEIKTTNQDLKKFKTDNEEWHLGQALFYGYMYLLSNPEVEVQIRLTYISQEDHKKEEYVFPFTHEEIKEKIIKYCDDYLAFIQREEQHLTERDASLNEVYFPFEHFRPGQKDMASLIYKALKNKQRVFIEAPTGIGKTMSVLYPALKEQKNSQGKVFYCTAKNSGHLAALKAFNILHDEGYKGRASFLYSREKMCLNEVLKCNPDACPFARAYYKKIKPIISKYLSFEGALTEELIKREAFENTVCPFEMQLDLSSYSDLVVMDYNYFIDPLVHLMRFFDEEADYKDQHVVLIDEAHNLLDRGRDSYSFQFTLKQLLEVKEHLKGQKKLLALTKNLNKMITFLKDAEDTISDYMDPEFLTYLINFENAVKRIKKNKESPELPKVVDDFDLEVHRANVLCEDYNKNIKVYIQGEGEEKSLSYFCLDPSEYLDESFKGVKSAILFSGTFSPLDYYEDALFGDTSFPSAAYPSPFPPKNLKIIVSDEIDTRYNVRDQSYDKVANYLKTLVDSKKGNYFVFFSSYAYLQSVYEHLKDADFKIIKQRKFMKENEKQDLIQSLEKKSNRSRLYLFVLGGSFGEGIDIPYNLLTGLAVVGVGLPQVGVETEALKDYFQEKNGQGFNYAYKNPGITKVFQAIGRLIRSETDTGVALLLDNRYLRRDYRNLLEQRFKNVEIIFSKDQLEDALNAFYKKAGF